MRKTVGSRVLHHRYSKSLDCDPNPEFALYLRQRYQNLVSNMMNTLTLIYYKLVELLMIADPSSGGLLKSMVMQMTELSLSDTSILEFIYGVVYFVVGVIILFFAVLLRKLEEFITGQPVPVPWF